MNREKFYNYLSKKYNLPYEYISFKINPYYIYNPTIELSLEYLEEFEESFNWDYIKADFEKDSTDIFKRILYLKMKKGC